MEAALFRRTDISVSCLETRKVIGFQELFEDGSGWRKSGWSLDEEWDITPTLFPEAILMKDVLEEGKEEEEEGGGQLPAELRPSEAPLGTVREHQLSSKPD